MFESIHTDPPFLSLRRPLSYRFTEFLEAVERHDLTIVVQAVCWQMFGHPKLERLDDTGREALLARCRIAVISAMMPDRRRRLPGVSPALAADGMQGLHQAGTEPWGYQSAHPVTRRLWQIWTEAEGRLAPAFLTIIEHLLILDDKAAAGEGPAILYCGEKSLPARLFGTEWAMTPNSRRLAIDPAFRRGIEAAYRGVIEHDEPSFDFLGGNVIAADGIPRHVDCERLILPVRTRTDARLLFCHIAPRTGERRARIARPFSAAI